MKVIKSLECGIEVFNVRNCGKTSIKDLLLEVIRVEEDEEPSIELFKNGLDCDQIFLVDDDNYIELDLDSLKHDHLEMSISTWIDEYVTPKYCSFIEDI